MLTVVGNRIAELETRLKTFVAVRDGLVGQYDVINEMEQSLSSLMDLERDTRHERLRLEDKSARFHNFVGGTPSISARETELLMLEAKTKADLDTLPHLIDNKRVELYEACLKVPDTCGCGIRYEKGYCDLTTDYGRRDFHRHTFQMIYGTQKTSLDKEIRTLHDEITYGKKLCVWLQWEGKYRVYATEHKVPGYAPDLPLEEIVTMCNRHHNRRLLAELGKRPDPMFTVTDTRSRSQRNHELSDEPDYTDLEVFNIEATSVKGTVVEVAV